MFISRKFRTAFGPALCSVPPPLVIPTDPEQARAFAIEADRDADMALSEGQFARAERLSHAAFEARCRAAAGAAR